MWWSPEEESGDGLLPFSSAAPPQCGLEQVTPSLGWAFDLGGEEAGRLGALGRDPAEPSSLRLQGWVVETVSFPGRHHLESGLRQERAIVTGGSQPG